MGEDRWPVEEWWSSHDHHMFPYKVPPAAGTAGGSYSQQSSGHWWYQNTQAPLHIPQPVSRGTGMSRQIKDAKPRGRMSAYAFFVQVCREEHKTKHPEEHVVFAEFSKKCAERWKTMTDSEKKRFHDMADKDKERFQNEMKDYVPPEHERKKKKRKQMKDPNAPKRPLSAFFLFSNVERHKIKEIHPAYKAGDTSKELGRRWSAADPSVKSKYQALADQEKVRYDREMTEYKQKGTFSRVDMSADGDVKKEESGGDDLEDDDE